MLVQNSLRCASGATMNGTNLHGNILVWRTENEWKGTGEGYPKQGTCPSWTEGRGHPQKGVNNEKVASGLLFLLRCINGPHKYQSSLKSGFLGG